MITVSGKNFSFQLNNIKDGISIKISSGGETKFNNVASQVKNQLADKPEVPKGKPFPAGEPPRVIEPLPKAPEVVELAPAEGIVLGDALDPPNGEFQIAGSPSKIEPTRNIPRDIVRVPSLDNIQFVETDLSRELEAEAAGGFDQELISATGLQPEVAGSAPLDAPEGIILGDALDPPNGEFQIAGSPSKIEPTRNIPRDIVRVPSLDNIQFVETDLSRKLAAEEAGGFDVDLISSTGIQPVVGRAPTFVAPEGVVLSEPLEQPDVAFDIALPIPLDGDGNPPISKPINPSGIPIVLEPQIPPMQDKPQTMTLNKPSVTPIVFGSEQPETHKPEVQVESNRRNIFNFVVSNS